MTRNVTHTEFDPERLFQQLETAAEEMAEARYAAGLLEKQEKVLLSKLELQWQRSGHSVASSKTFALADPKYETHINGMVEAQRKATLTTAHYNNIRAYVDLVRTKETSARALIHGR